MCLKLHQLSYPSFFSFSLTAGRWSRSSGRFGVGVLRATDGTVHGGPGGTRGGPAAGLVRAQSPQLIRWWRRCRWSDTWPSGKLLPRWTPEQPQSTDLRARKVLRKYLVRNRASTLPQLASFQFLFVSPKCWPHLINEQSDVLRQNIF